MIVTSIQDIKSQPLFFEMSKLVPNIQLYLKLEGLNIAGSIKLKTAKFLINGLERSNKLEKGKSIIIESSSGNLGIALALVCKERGYGFSCVVDPNILPAKERVLQLYGAEVIKVTEKDKSGGYLATRIKKIKDLLQQDNCYVWTNQYASQDNIAAHYHETAKEIFSAIKEVDYLFIGAGTTGTLMGCAQYCRKHALPTKVIAVDAVGSVTFGATPATRYIPGVGTSKCPEIVDSSLLSDIVWVDELNAIKMCKHLLNEYGLLVGGSTGSVLHAIKTYPALKNIEQDTKIVAISPDFGQAYVDSIFNNAWIDSHFDINRGHVNGI